MKPIVNNGWVMFGIYCDEYLIDVSVDEQTAVEACRKFRSILNYRLSNILFFTRNYEVWNFSPTDFIRYYIYNERTYNPVGQIVSVFVKSQNDMDNFMEVCRSFSNSELPKSYKTFYLNTPLSFPSLFKPEERCWRMVANEKQIKALIE